MRKLTTIQQKENLNHVFAKDEKGAGGANHEYVVHITPTEDAVITFQNGPRKEQGSVHGLVDQDLLEIVKDRLTGFQEGDFASEYNAKALYHLNKALEAMNQRVEDRIKRNVLGTYNK